MEVLETKAGECHKEYFFPTLANRNSSRWQEAGTAKAVQNCRALTALHALAASRASAKCFFRPFRERKGVGDFFLNGRTSLQKNSHDKKAVGKNGTSKVSSDYDQSFVSL